MEKELFLIDIEQRGHLLKLYFGNDNDYWGDDWNDTPYEHNSEIVYDKYVKAIMYVAIPFEYDIITPEEDYTYRGNSPFCKNDFKTNSNKYPYMIIKNRDFPSIYSQEILKMDNIQLKFNTSLEETLVLLKMIALNEVKVNYLDEYI